MRYPPYAFDALPVAVVEEHQACRDTELRAPGIRYSVLRGDGGGFFTPVPYFKYARWAFNFLNPLRRRLLPRWRKEADVPR